MASAFDWSPGGCCCESPSQFEFYFSDGRNGYTRDSKFVSVPFHYPAAATWTYNSKRPAETWWIDPSAPIARTTFVARGGSGPNVWSFEERPNGIGVDNWMVHYDTRLKQQLAATNTTASPVGIGKNTGFGCDQESWCQLSRATTQIGVQPGPLQYVQSAKCALLTGSGNTFSAQENLEAAIVVKSPGTWTIELYGFGSAIYTLSDGPLVARREARRSVGTKERWNSTTGSMIEFYVGELAAGGGALSLANKQTVFSYATTRLFVTDVRPRWHTFDSWNGHWAGTISYNEIAANGDPVPRFKFLIDGTPAWEITPIGVPNDQVPLITSTPHVTQRGNYVVISRRSDLPIPNAAKPYRLYIYKDGLLVWQGPQVGPNAPVCTHSNEDWIYFSTNEESVATVTGGAYSSAQTRSNWRVNYDTFEVQPGGTLTTTASVINDLPRDAFNSRAPGNWDHLVEVAMNGDSPPTQ